MPSIIKSLLHSKQRKIQPATPKKDNALNSWFSSSQPQHAEDDEPVQLKTKRKGLFETIRSSFKKLSLHDDPPKPVTKNIFAVNLPSPLEQLQGKVDAEFERLIREANPTNIDYLLSIVAEPVTTMMQQLDDAVCLKLGNWRDYHSSGQTPISATNNLDEEAVKYCCSIYENRLNVQPVEEVPRFSQQVEQARLEFIEGDVVNNVNLSRRPSADQSMTRSDSFGLNWLMDDRFY